MVGADDQFRLLARSRKAWIINAPSKPLAMDIPTVSGSGSGRFVATATPIAIPTTNAQYRPDRDCLRRLGILKRSDIRPAPAPTKPIALGSNRGIRSPVTPIVPPKHHFTLGDKSIVSSKFDPSSSD